MVSTAPPTSILASGAHASKLITGLSCRLLVVVLEIFGATISQRRMSTLSIVPNFDPLVNCCADFFARLPLLAMDQFRFDGCIETLDDSVIPAVSFSTHTADDAVIVEQLLKRGAGVLTSAI